MLGYVLPDKGELKVREYEIYGGYYCGVCKYIGKTYGQLPRMVLSYDAAFMALLFACVDPAPDEPVQEHCVAHHIKRKTIIRNRAIEYAGDLMLILAWFKLLDDAQDEGRASAKAGLAAYRRIWRKLQSKHPSLCESIGKHLAELNELERAHCPSIDRVAEGFAQVMVDIFRDGITWLYGEPQSSLRPDAAADPQDCRSSAEIVPALHETFAKIGYHLGKWIYLIDATDDIEENLDSGSYNPLLYRFAYRDGTGRFGDGGSLGDGDSLGDGGSQMPQAAQASEASDSAETPEQFRARIDDSLRFNLFHYLAVISESLEALDIQKNSGIIENIIYFGLNRKTEEILRRTQPEQRRRGPL